VPSSTYDEWLREVPLVERKSKQTWRAKIEELRQAAREAGRPELLLANNEYGLGKPSQLVGFNRFTKSMVVTEFALEMYASGYDVAAFWDNSDGGQYSHDDQMLLATAEGYRFNPMHIGLEMLAESVGMQMLRMTVNFTNPNVHIARVHGFAAGAGSEQRVYLINKMQTAQLVRVELPARSAALTRATSMVDTTDHWGAKISSSISCTNVAREDKPSLSCNFELPPVSFTMLDGGSALGSAEYVI